jgi:hypothetical protein
MTNETDNTHANSPKFQPCTPLGKQLWALRQQHIANGGKLLTGDELDKEIEERRGGAKLWQVDGKNTD